MRLLPLALLGSTLAVGGCSDLGQLTGLVAGAIAGGGTVNPAVGYVVAVGTAAVADEAFKWIDRNRHGAEQDAIASVAGGLPEGGAGAWKIEHTIPLGDEHGEVRVVRAIDTQLANCREIVFSVQDDPPAHPAWYSTSICQQAAGWKWGEAEPAVGRWGYLQ